MFDSDPPRSPPSCVPDTVKRGRQAANHPDISTPEKGAPTASAGGLGKYAKFVDQTADDDHRKTQRRKAFHLQRVAAGLIPMERVGKCRWTIATKASGVEVILTKYERGGEAVAHFGGLQTCGSVWHCPTCSRRISETRRKELNAALAWARESLIIPVMITLTSRHDASELVSDQLDLMKRAKQRLHQRREWRALKPVLEGSITATELTHGGNGWHIHFHTLLFIAVESEGIALDLVEPLAGAWRSCLLGLGRTGNKAAFQAQGAANVGDYVAKWGAAEELTLTRAKEGRNGGRTPLELLAAFDEGDEEAGRLWRAYALAFKGRQQLVWSPGLKKRAGVSEVSDDEAANDQEQADEESQEVLAFIKAITWKQVRHRRADILDAAETDGAEGVAMVIEGRDEHGDAFAVIEGFSSPSSGETSAKEEKTSPRRSDPHESGKPRACRGGIGALPDLFGDEGSPKDERTGTNEAGHREGYRGDPRRLLDGVRRRRCGD